MMTFTVKETGYSPKLALRKLKEMNLATVHAMGDYWHEHFREKHFTQAGAREYGYAPRNVGYMIKKAKKWGHRNPLVWSGVSRALSKIKHLVPSGTSQSARVRVVLHTPALNLIPKGGRINLRAEMEKVSPAEGAVIAQVGADEKNRQYSLLNDSTTTTIG
jgi:hypothetical protein